MQLRHYPSRKDFIRAMAQSPDTLKVIRFARTDENLHMKKDELYGYQGYYQRRVDDFVYSIELIKDFSQEDSFTFNYAIIRAESDMFFPQSNENLIYRKVDEALKPISEH